MKKRLCNAHTRLIMFLAVAVILFTPVQMHADNGPKPSVEVNFRGLEDEHYYATLLSEAESTGPASAWDGSVSGAYCHEGDEDYEIWKKFVEYEDVHGYYFLQWYWNCDETDQMRWGYYPPSPFKILIYFPESDTFAVSGIYERYAFDSYFQVTVEDCDSLTVSQITAPQLTVEKNYDYTWELISLAARIVITILIELGLAALFGYRTKKQFGFITVVNIATQIILNVCLNLINYNRGYRAFTLLYILLEIMVFAIEAALYSRRMQDNVDTLEKRGKPVLYAFIANLVSFAAGLVLAHLIPGIY